MQADVVEFLIGEERTSMAADATSLAQEELRAALLREGQRLRIAKDPRVEASGAAVQRALVGGDGLAVVHDHAGDEIAIGFRHAVVLRAVAGHAVTSARRGARALATRRRGREHGKA